MAAGTGLQTAGRGLERGIMDTESPGNAQTFPVRLLPVLEATA